MDGVDQAQTRFIACGEPLFRHFLLEGRIRFYCFRNDVGRADVSCLGVVLELVPLDTVGGLGRSIDRYDGAVRKLPQFLIGNARTASDIDRRSIDDTDGVL